MTRMHRLCPGVVPGTMFPCANEIEGRGIGKSFEFDGWRLCMSCRRWAEENKSKAIHNTKCNLIVYKSEGFVPENIADFAWANSTQTDTKAWQKATEWNPSKENMYLHGKAGRGKTWLARAWLVRCVHRGFSVAELKGAEFQVSNKSINFAKPWIERLEMRGVLLLDDIHDALAGTVAQKEFALMSLKALLDRRYECGLRTILTTNLTGDEFLQMMKHCQGDDKTVASTIVDRLKPSLSIEMKGESLRGK